MTGPTETRGPSRAELWRWSGWFGAANAALAALIGARYLLYYDFPADLLGLVYTPLAYVGHYASLGLLTVLPSLLLAALWPRRLLTMAPAVVLGAALLTLLMVDANVFAEHRYHLTPFTVAIFEPATWLLIGLIGLISLVFQALLADALRGWVARRPGRGGVALGVGLTVVWLAAQGIHVWGDAVGYRSVTQLTRFLPAYLPIHSRRGLARLGLVDPKAVEEQRLLARAGSGTGEGQLRYPQAPLQCVAPEQPLNLLLVFIDGLRPDVVDATLMPNLAAFQAAGQDFSNHYSGGNSTKAGAFSLFYGLPSTYMDAFYGVQQPPVLLTELRRQHYALGLFSAPGLATPMDLDRTAFAGVPDLPVMRRDLAPVARNEAVTSQWLAWLKDRNGSGPFFGFIYYDPPIGVMSADAGTGASPQDHLPGTSERVNSVWRQYRRAMAFTDRQLGLVLGGLRESGLDDQTVVVVFSDHGYEFGETGGDLLGHASNYSPAQVRSVLALNWPGRPAVRYSHRTSHHSVAATLLQDLLGCRNPPTDYSVGGNLFDGKSWDWIIVGSYQSYAIIDPENIVVAHPGGFMERLDENYRPANRQALDAATIEAALRETRRFYQ